MKEVSLHTVRSLEEKNSFSDLEVKFGFAPKLVGKESKNDDYHYLKQIHSTNLRKAAPQNSGSFEGERQEGDALYTDEPGRVVAVKTADCLPLLVTDLEASFVLAIHAGWKGLAAGIIEKSLLEVQKKQKTKAENFAVFMGPCISFEAFEVGPEVIEVFQKSALKFMSEASFKTCYKSGEGDRSFFSLKQYAFFSLLNFGLKKERISSLDSCTYLENKNWFSYRHKKNLEGYNWSWVCQQEAYLVELV